MDKKNDLAYSKSISARITLIMERSGLTLAGLSEFAKVSESHLYAVINGNRDLTGAIAEKLAKPFKLKGWQILQLDYSIPTSIDKATELVSFKKEFRSNVEYFHETKNSTKKSHFIEYGLLEHDLFSNPVYVWEIIEYLAKQDIHYSSKELSQILHYLVSKGKLKSKKAPMKLKGGGYGSRIVEIFYS